MSQGIVCDCSAIMGLFFEDERTDYHDGLLNALSTNMAYVPSIWPSEVGNVFYLSEKRNRLTAAQVSRFMQDLILMEFDVVDYASLEKINEAILLAKQYDLTVYDAQYLHLAIELSLPLATRDKALAKAAATAGVAVL